MGNCVRPHMLGRRITHERRGSSLVSLQNLAHFRRRGYVSNGSKPVGLGSSTTFLLHPEHRTFERKSSNAASGPGRVKSRRRSTAIEEVIRSRPLCVPTSQANLILRSNLRTSFLSRFDFSAFHTAWATSRHYRLSIGFIVV